MCTAVTYKTADFYFGRNLDYDVSFGEEVTITPRKFPLRFREMGTLEVHHAIIGMARVAEDYPLYFDAVNERGLGMAGLNFVGYAEYKPKMPGKDNIASFELIPWILGQCATVAQARMLLERIHLTDAAFSPALPPTGLHWIIADRWEAVTVEQVEEGLRVYSNPVGVLTNNPPFEVQMLHLSNYMNLSPGEPGNRFSEEIDLHPYSRGMGALGLPGDLSSQSRFVRAAFTKLNSRSGSGEAESVGQFFHILDAVAQVRGCCRVGKGYEVTRYAACCNADRGIYYYTTYENRSITAVDMHGEDLDGMELRCYPLIRTEGIRFQNQTSR